VTSPVVPARWQPALPLDRLVVDVGDAPPPSDAIEVDVAVVGAGPAGLAFAVEYARRAKEVGREVSVAVLEKAEEVGQHSLSGAVVDPRALRDLFPGVPDADLPLRAPVGKERVRFLTERRAFRIPVPPPMRNHGNRVASLCEVVRFLAKKAEEAGVDLFPGTPAASLLVRGDRVVGVRTAESGLLRDGRPGPSHAAGTDVRAKVTVLAEGSRGALAQVFFERSGIRSPNPQIYALGVKEIWRTKGALDAVVHTMGWPVPKEAFGGSFLYPLEPNLVAIGLVVGLDSRRADTDVHALLQRLKTHPSIRPLLEGGEMVEWGAKTIPEGGWWSLPERRHGPGALVLGDSAGFVDVPSLKGVHYAMRSGILAARAAVAATAEGASDDALSAYDREMDATAEMTVLRRRRNMRLAFRDGFFAGVLNSALATLTKGAFPGRRFAVEPDAEVPREVRADARALVPDGRLTFSKTDGVFRAGNRTRDDVPSHLVVGTDVPPEMADLWAATCPAGVYERRGDRLVVNAPNCVDCKATDVVGPRWTPREGGSGPRYQRM
jgi:electron-transferring-flavoprotein dehydrogenase